VKVLAGMLVFRIIAAAYVAADQAEAQMDPCITLCKAFLAALNTGCDRLYQIEVCALLIQGVLLMVTQRT
jgi:hypothetical protein